MAINSSDVPTLTVLLSPERLGVLTNLTGSGETATELHQATLRLGVALMNVIATIEIALRNSISENLSHYFAVPNWLQQPPVALRWKEQERKKIALTIDTARRAEYSKLSQADKAKLEALAYPKGRPPNTSHLKRAKDRQRYIPVTEGKVIAELTFYFWRRLYGPEYEQALWRPSLKRTFPDKKLSRASVAIQLEHLYQARNRLAHHEPVLHRRFVDTMAAVEFTTQCLGVTAPSPHTPLANLLTEDIADVRTKESELGARLDSFRA
jgi:hypothetical protein